MPQQTDPGTELALIGIGTGNPAHLTAEARDAIASADLILVPSKGRAKSDLADLRHQIIAGIRDAAPVTTYQMPERNPELPYLQAVDEWHAAIALIWAGLLPEGPARVALLVWGDPALYDSSLRIAARLTPRPRVRVIPGITAIQALCAAHAIPLNTLAGPVTLTTGRRLTRHGWPPEAETVVVMLDAHCAFQSLEIDGLHIWWGAYLGMPDQALISGPVAEIGAAIQAERARLRERTGWIMDTYLLRQNSDLLRQSAE